jgi:cyclin C
VCANVSRCSVIHHLGLRLGLRQRVISTAQIFFKRFYLQYSFVSFDPRLAAPTMLFVAAKVEECPVNAKIVLQKLNRMEGASLAPPGTGPQPQMPSPALVNASAPGAPTPTNLASTNLPYLYEIDDLIEMEFAILVGLKYDLIVYHPYRPLIQSATQQRRVWLQRRR